MSITNSDVTYHRPVDNSDTGFKIKGHVLRWVSGGVEARRAPRFWQPLKVSKLPKEMQEKLKATHGSHVDGDTIRRRDLVLSYAPESVVQERRKDIKEQQRANEAVFRASQQVGNTALKTTSDTSATTERLSSEQFK